MITGTVYEDSYNEMKIMALLTADCWEVYYRKPGFAYEFAFGLPDKENIANVLNLARANASSYDDLFTEDDVDDDLKHSIKFLLKDYFHKLERDDVDPYAVKKMKMVNNILDTLEAHNENRN